jgi:hypothetical protein
MAASTKAEADADGGDEAVAVEGVPEDEPKAE